MSKQTYTLEEAERELKRRECLTHGHDWRVIEYLGRGPVRIVCERCGDTHEIRQEGEGR